MQKLPLPPADILNEKVLDRLILKRIQQQLASSSGILIDDVILNETLHNIARQNNMTLSQFHDALQLDGLDFELFRDNIRDEITFRQLRQRNVDSRITVSEQEIDIFIDSQRVQGQSDHEYHLAHILIAVPEAASAEHIQQARQQGEEVLKQLNSGANFQQMAIQYSDGQQALEGGDLGWRRGVELPTLFTDTVMAMADSNDPNSRISNLIRSPSGFHIIKLLEQRGGERHIINQTQARHILISPDALTSDNDALQQILALKKQLQEGNADFASMAREYSDDKGTASQGGDLGWVNPGAMVPDFEKVMLALNPGEISAPVKTRFGWHLIEVIARRQQDDTDDFNRNQVRQLIFQRKAEEAYTTWLQRLRTEAYVENRLDTP
jgi:peptidyl-prolyl cis-trans isomerase SurA